MYQLTYDSKILFDPYMQSTAITDAKYTGKSNSVSYLDFTIAPNHPLYNTIEKDKGLVEFYSDNVLKFRGKINEIEIDDYGYKIVSCNSVLQYLNHTRVRSYSTVPGDADLTAPTSAEGYFQWLIDQHNLHVKDASERFEVGVNQCAALDKNDYILRSNDNYPTTLDEINDKVLDSLGGYLFVEYKDDRNILNLYADVHSTNSQIIDFGSNILSISYKENDDELYTVVIPRGGTPEKKEGDTKDPKPINIKNLPDNTFDTDSDIVKSGDCVYSLSATKRYGYREYYYSNNDILDPSNLLKAAVLQLRLQMSPKVTIETKAIDLSIAYPGYEQLNIGDACRVRSARHNLDDYFMLSEMELDLNDPSQTTYTFGDEYVSLIGRQSNYLKQINSSIDRNYEDVNTAMNYGKAAAKLADTANKTADAANNTAVKANDKAQKATEDAFNANTTANNAQSTANTANTTANNAQSTANTAKNTADKAQTTATEASKTATDAKTTADSANKAAGELKKKTAEIDKQVEAVSNAADAASAKATTVEQNLNGFKTTVAETYTTKNDFNDLTIGGRNLLLNSNFSKGTDNWVLELQNNGLGTVKAEALSGVDFATTMLTIDVTNNTSDLCRIYQLRSPNPMRTDTVDTVSFWANASETVPVNFGRNDDNRFITVQKGWHYYTATVPKWTTSMAFSIGFKNGFIGTLNITNIMWEHASKASQWSPAPEDLQPAGDYSTKSYVDQTANSVALGVVQNYKGADGSGLATKSDITVAKDSITSTVANTYATKSGVTQEISSKITQNNNSLDVKFATKTETQEAQNTASDAQSRIGDLEPCIRMTSDGVRVGKQVNGTYQGSSALVGTDGTFDVLNSSSERLLEVGANGVKFPKSSDGRQLSLGYLSDSDPDTASTLYIGDIVSETQEGGPKNRLGFTDNEVSLNGGNINILAYDHQLSMYGRKSANLLVGYGGNVMVGGQDDASDTNLILHASTVNLKGTIKCNDRGWFKESVALGKDTVDILYSPFLVTVIFHTRMTNPASWSHDDAKNAIREGYRPIVYVCSSLSTDNGSASTSVIGSVYEDGTIRIETRGGSFSSDAHYGSITYPVQI